MSPDICLVAPGHLASTPRLVKNANALSEAGYRIHVVSGRHFAPAEPLDQAILTASSWSNTRVGFRRGWRGLSNRLLRKAAHKLVARFDTDWPLAARAQHAGHRALAEAAAASGAKFFYGHGGIAGLAAAAAAAHLTGGTFGFDAEDWHLEENDHVQRDPAERRAARILLNTLLPKVRMATCAAPLIGDAYKTVFGLDPVCLLNVFPRTEAPSSAAVRAAPSHSHPAILYWFSQTIGPGRGLEAMLDTLAHLQTPAVLHLRGFVANDYADSLRTRAGKKAGQLRFSPPAPPAKMARLAAPAHLGLSLEIPIPRNHDLCLSNKIFTYLLAGVPVALTPTAAQDALLPQLGSAALHLRFHDPRRTAVVLDHWLLHEASNAAAHAWRLGQDRFNWDHERTKLLDLFQQNLGSPR